MGTVVNFVDHGREQYRAGLYTGCNDAPKVFHCAFWCRLPHFKHNLFSVQIHVVSFLTDYCISLGATFKPENAVSNHLRPRDTCQSELWTHRVKIMIINRINVAGKYSS